MALLTAPDANLAARLVVVRARANRADLLADVVSELEALASDERLALRLGRLGVLLRLLHQILALGGQVGRVDVAVREEDGHAVLGLALRLRAYIGIEAGRSDLVTRAD